MRLGAVEVNPKILSVVEHVPIKSISKSNWSQFCPRFPVSTAIYGKNKWNGGRYWIRTNDLLRVEQAL